MNRPLFVLSLVAFCAFTAATVNAQEVKLGGVVSGFGAWYGGSDWNDAIDDIDGQQGVSASNQVRFGFSVGPAIEVGLVENFAVGTAVQYSRRGGGIEVTRNDGSSADGTEVVNFVDIPGYLKPRLPLAAGISIHALIGPQVSFIIGDVAREVEEGFVGVSETSSKSVEPDNRLIFGPTVGTGIAVNLGVGELHVDLLYFRSFNAAFDDFIFETGETFEGDLFQNLGLSLGLMIPLETDSTNSFTTGGPPVDSAAPVAY